MKKIKKRGIAKTAPKAREKVIVENAKRLLDNVFLVVPIPYGEKAKKAVAKLRKRLEKVDRFKGDVKRLEKLSKKKGFAGALAGTLLIAHSGKAPYLASVRIGGKEVMYAVRGKADRDLLISFQHFDDPILRLVGFKEFAFKNKLALYSWNEHFVCTDRKVPEEFIEFIVKELGLEKKGDLACCQHLASNSKDNHLRIRWENANLIMKICLQCGKNKNTIMEMSKYFIDPNLREHIHPEVILKTSSEGRKDHLDEYLFGNLTDAGFIEKNIDEWKKSLKGRIYILRDVSYGTDVEKFIRELKPNEVEERALRMIFSKLEEPVIAEDASPNKVLATYWKRFGLEVLEEFTKDRDLAKELYDLPYPPSKILEIAVSIKQKKEKLSRFPSIRSPSPAIEFIDKLAKSYLIFGKEKVLSMLSKPPKDVKQRSIAFAFLLAIGKGEDRKWQYTEIEQEYGAYLKDFVDRLLKSDPENYRKNFNDLLSACGFEERV